MRGCLRTYCADIDEQAKPTPIRLPPIDGTGSCPSACPWPWVIQANYLLVDCPEWPSLRDLMDRDALAAAMAALCHGIPADSGSGAQERMAWLDNMSVELAHELLARGWGGA